MTSSLTWIAGSAIDDTQRRAFALLLSRALLFPSLANDDWTVREGHAHFRIAMEHQRVVGGMTSQPVGQWFGGASVPCAAIRCVAVAAELRRKGIASFMLKSHLAELRENGTPLAALYPSNLAVYRNAGFEVAGTRSVYRVPSHVLAVAQTNTRISNELTIVPVENFTREALEPSYTLRARRSNGCLDRSEFFWSRIRRRPGTSVPTDVQCFLFMRGNDTEGYVLFSVARDAGDQVLLVVHDMVLHTEPAARACLGLLADQRTIVDRIKWVGPVNDPVFTLFASPAFEMADQALWMLRIVHAESALSRRGYPPFVQTEIHFDIHDRFMPENHGTFVLDVHDGSAQVRRGGRGDVRIDIRGLAALYACHMPANTLASVGLLHADDLSMARLDAVFSGPVSWMTDAF